MIKTINSGLLFAFGIILLTGSGCVVQKTESALVEEMFTGKWNIELYEEDNYFSSITKHSTNKKEGKNTTEYKKGGKYYSKGKEIGAWTLEDNNLLFLDKGTKSERYYVILSISNSFMVRKGPFYAQSPHTKKQIFTFYCKKVK